MLNSESADFALQAPTRQPNVQGCCDKATSSPLMPFEVAVAKVQEEARKLDEDLIQAHGCRLTEMVAISNCMGRMLANDIVAPEALPPFMCSKMDGFALRYTDVEKTRQQKILQGKTTASFTESSHVEFSIKQRRLAGPAINTVKLVEPVLNANLQCIAVMTGAPLPEGYNCVVKIEDTNALRFEGCHSVSISREVLNEPKEGTNVRLPGSDCKLGANVLARGIPSPE